MAYILMYGKPEHVERYNKHIDLEVDAISHAEKQTKLMNMLVIGVSCHTGRVSSDSL